MGKIGGMAQEDMAFRSSIAGPRGGNADRYRLRQGAIDGVGQRMHADIGVRMAQKRSVMGRILHSQTWIAGRKGVDVVTIAKADIHHAPRTRPGARNQRIGQLRLSSSPGVTVTVLADRQVPRHRCTLGMGAMGGKDGVQRETLRARARISPSRLAPPARGQLGAPEHRSRAGRCGRRRLQRRDHVMMTSAEISGRAPSWISNTGDAAAPLSSAARTLLLALPATSVTEAPARPCAMSWGQRHHDLGKSGESGDRARQHASSARAIAWVQVAGARAAPGGRTMVAHVAGIVMAASFRRCAPAGRNCRTRCRTRLRGRLILAAKSQAMVYCGASAYKGATFAKGHIACPPRMPT